MTPHAIDPGVSPAIALEAASEVAMAPRLILRDAWSDPGWMRRSVADLRQLQRHFTQL
jgi:hypothetical protein